MNAACRKLCVARFNMLKMMEEENKNEMLALLDLFCHDVRRHSPILVRPQNPKEIEISAIEV